MSTRYRPQTKEEAEIYEIFQDMILKSRITNVFLGVFLAVAAFFIVSLCTQMSITTKLISGGFDVLLSPTVFLMSKHYFGAVRRARTIP